MPVVAAKADPRFHPARTRVNPPAGTGISSNRPTLFVGNQVFDLRVETKPTTPRSPAGRDGFAALMAPVQCHRCEGEALGDPLELFETDLDRRRGCG